MTQSVTREIAGKTIRLETGRVARQAGGAVWLYCGDTVVQATATMSREARLGIDFFPLTCDYEERKYAVGKIPGGYVKRGGRPAEKSVLTSRLIDRPLRPLFPDGMRNDVQVIAMPLSADADQRTDVLAMLAASAALTVSNIPFMGPIGAVRVARMEGEFIINPSFAETEESDLDLIVAGTRDAVLMIEAGAKFISETTLMEAIDAAHRVICEQCDLQDELARLVNVQKSEVQLHLPDTEILEAIQTQMGDEIRATIQNPDKAARESAIDDLKREIVERFTPQFSERAGEIAECAEKAVKKQIRHIIVHENVRPDGRKPDEIRPITCEVGVLPRVHGTGLFTRGQTQVLTALTLGTVGEGELVDNLEEEVKKRYMHYYNFPPYSVGEVRPLRSAGRREIGHGALAERALVPVLPPVDAFPYSLLLQSEVLESNGSTSMASVCGSTLALLDAGVKISAPVAGIAMGLMTLDGQYKVLTDIQGMEDFSGDMDFKVAGTDEGITAIQLDCKIRGLPREVMVAALDQAKAGRLHILGKINEALSAPREGLSQYAPAVITIEINPERIGEVIGPGGKMIKKITAETGAQIDIQQDGKIYISSSTQEGGQKAAGIIMGMVSDILPGTIFTGTVTRLMGIGAFVEILPGKEGLVHTSNLASPAPRRPDDVVKVGSELQVRVIEVDGQGRVNLSAINLDQPFDPSTVRHEERGGRGGRDRDRGGDRDRGDRGDRDRSRGSAPQAAPSRPEPEVEEEEGVPRARFRPRR